MPVLHPMAEAPQVFWSLPHCGARSRLEVLPKHAVPSEQSSHLSHFSWRISHFPRSKFCFPGVKACVEWGSGESWWHCSALPNPPAWWGEVRTGLSSNCPAHRPDVGGLELTQTCPLLMADPLVWVFSHMPQITPCFSLLHEGPSCYSTLLETLPGNGS